MFVVQYSSYMKKKSAQTDETRRVIYLVEGGEVFLIVFDGSG